MGSSRPKTPPPPKVEKVDPTEAIKDFEAGYDAIAKAWPTALEEYEYAIQTGASAAIGAITEAQLMALPYSETAKAAVAEIREFTGLKPVSKTAGLSVAIQGLQDEIRASTKAEAIAEMGHLDKLSEISRKAELAQTPEERQQVLAEFQQQAGVLSQTEGLKDFSSQLGTITSKFLSDYEAVPGKALTPNEIQERVNKLPGFQAQLAQGQQTLERSAAAQGGLLSGRSLVAAQQLGQSLSTQAYESHLTRLTNLAAQNLPFAQQQIALQAAKSDIATTEGGLLGAARKESIQGVADAYRIYETQSGQARQNVAITAAQAQNNANLAHFQAKVGASSQGGWGAAATGLLGAGLGAYFAPAGKTIEAATLGGQLGSAFKL